ncbi:MAG: hypothetical protein DKM50_02750 [Candidatus Margulisiibacteriota bacterium]|nr:MAG: hypothetical protein A2X43_03475 [Candidatus Margulisbacteria bacterium GWD2_39_127]OGI04010.1 MAG: hypothetical protein A2X42_11720 [Candidatus Margulisbacteria bacterium GWF2_38_17]OGI06533.1 MAG: hypothetical protein A2X41_02600 [Candidatus Margulisbacteria bacterium GWE2_39_32]PZM83212.1 MAG: hypothetical protein DKM50_02750 [Candidatus Margulisiibacteriota bacterium]HAR62483.1 hypothetical protein [Candidatus Margulisiibacteriota bacterium]
MKKILIVSEYRENDPRYFQVTSIINFIRSQGYDLDIFDMHKFVIPRLPWEININFVYLRSLFLVKHIVRTKPDIVFVLKGHGILRKTIAKARSLASATRFILHAYDDIFGVINDYSRSSCIREYDIVALYDKYNWEELNERHINSIYTPLWFDKELFDSVTVKGKKYDVTFAGSWNKKREKLLNELVEIYPDIGLHIWGPDWNHCSYKNLMKFYHPEAVYAEKMVMIFKESKILINIFDEHTIKATNYRTYEALGSKSLLINEANSELNNLFKIGEHLDVFSNARELKEKIKYYLNNEELCREMSDTAYNYVSENYTLAHFMNKIFDSIK